MIFITMSCNFVNYMICFGSKLTAQIKTTGAKTAYNERGKFKSMHFSDFMGCAFARCFDRLLVQAILTCKRLETTGSVSAHFSEM